MYSGGAQLSMAESSQVPQARGVRHRVLINGAAPFDHASRDAHEAVSSPVVPLSKLLGGTCEREVYVQILQAVCWTELRAWHVWELGEESSE